MKRSQNLKILDLLSRDGFVTTRRIMQKCAVNQPFQRLSEIRGVIDLEVKRVKSGNIYFKIWHLPRKASVVARYMQDNNYRMYPAAATSLGTFDNAATGSIIYDFGGVYLNSS